MQQQTAFIQGKPPHLSPRWKAFAMKGTGQVMLSLNGQAERSVRDEILDFIPQMPDGA
ncbi:hypothetical protein SAMN04488123_101378, partial [Natribacillus halophilus]